MSQNDFVINNGTGLAVRQDIESAFQALASNNSGSSTPSTTYAYQFWADSSAGTLKIRNSANNAWIELLQLDGTLTLEDGSASAPALGFRDDLDTGIFSGGANEFNIATGGSERLAIDSSGNLLHGVTASEDTTGNSGTKLITTGDLQIDGDQKALVFRSTASTAQKMSGIQWWNESGAGVQCAIFGIRETVTLAKGALAFYTSDNVDTADNNGEGNITERMRIDSSGRVMIGVSSTTHASTNADDLCVGNNDSSSQHGITIGSNNAGSIRFADSASGGVGIINYEHGTADTMTFYTAGNLRMSIDGSGNIGAPSGTNIYNASDLRLKKNVVDLDKGLSAIKSLRPVSFNWIDGFCDEEKQTLYGFIAQEVKTIDSNLVQKFSDTPLTIEEQVIDNPLTVNEKLIIPMLVKAVQELEAKVAALEAA